MCRKTRAWVGLVFLLAACAGTPAPDTTPGATTTTTSAITTTLATAGDPSRWSSLDLTPAFTPSFSAPYPRFQISSEGGGLLLFSGGGGLGTFYRSSTPADVFFRQLTDNPNLNLTDIEETSMGGLPTKAVKVDVKPDADFQTCLDLFGVECIPFFSAGGGRQWVFPVGVQSQVWIMDTGTGSVLVVAEPDQSDDGAYTQMIDEWLDGLVWD